jgi:ABC-type transport system substrate-binding protein
MKKNLQMLILVIAVWVLGSLLAACAPAPAAATEAAATEAAASTTEPAPVFTVKADCVDGGSEINSIEAVDDLTVKFTLCRPDPAFLMKVALANFGIEPAEYLTSTGGTGDLLTAPVGTGPYKMEAWNRGESLVMTRNDDYWGDKAIAQTLIFKWSADASARVVELQAGTVDGIDNVDVKDVATVRDDSNLQLIPRPALNVFYLGMTNTFKPYDDVRVRQAIGMGIDRQRIVDTFYAPGSEVAAYFTPCGIPNGCVGDKWYDFDPVAAKKLLAEAGFADGFKTTIYYRDVTRSYLPNVGKVAEDVQAQLKENLNIDAEIVVMESGDFTSKASAGQLDGIHMFGWGADYPQITNFMDYHFSGNPPNPQWGTPYPEILNPLAEGAKIGNPADAESIYVEANNALRTLVPLVPIAHGASNLAYRADVVGAHASPLGNEYFAAMDPGGRDTFIWMQSGEPISLYCGDEEDGESLRACQQMVETLLSYEVGGTAVKPGLATGCEPNDDLTVWTCTLRDGVKFHDGSTLDANDVIASWSVGLDASSPLHKGNTSAFAYFAQVWGLINTP